MKKTIYSNSSCAQLAHTLLELLFPVNGSWIRWCVGCFFLLPFAANAQAQLQVSNTSSFTGSDFQFDYSIIYNEVIDKQVYLKTDVLDSNNALVMSCYSDGVIIKQGYNHFNADSKIAQSRRIIKPDQFENGMLMNGKYTICFVLIQTENGFELDKKCIVKTVVNTLEPKMEKNDTIEKTDSAARLLKQYLSKTFKYNATSKIEYYQNDNHYVGQQAPNKYYRAELNSSIKLFSLPFTSYVFYSNEQSGMNNTINLFNLNFDAMSYKRALISKAEKIIDEKYQQELNEYDFVLEKLRGEKVELNRKIGEPDKPVVGTPAMKKRNYRGISKPDSLNLNHDKSIELPDDSMETIRMDEKIRMKKRVEDLDEKIAHFEKLRSEVDEKKKLEKVGMSDDSKLIKELGQKNKAFQMSKGLLAVKSFGIGSNFINYSSYTINGLNLNGVNAEIYKGLFYGAFAYGKYKTSYMNDNKTFQVYRLGIGKKENTHLHFINLKSYGQNYTAPDSIITSVNNSGSTVINGINDVNSIESKLVISKELQFEGEYAKSKVTEISSASPDGNHQPSLVIADNVFADKLAKQAVLFKVKGDLANINTSYMTSFRYVEKDYVSFGSLGLRSDLMRYEAKLDNKFLKGRVTTSTYFKEDQDNISKTRSVSTVYDMFSFTVSYLPKKAPYVRVTYTPSSQRSIEEGSKVEKYTYKGNNYMIGSGYNYSAFNISMFSNAVITFQENRFISQGTRTFNEYTTLTQDLIFSFPVKVHMGYTTMYASAMGTEVNSTLNQKDISVSFDKDSYSFLTGYSSLIDALGTSRQSIYSKAIIKRFKKLGVFEMSYERFFYNQSALYTNKYSLRASLINRW